jgi:hypothetical protein
MTHTFAPMLSTVADARFRTPANIEVICTIKNTAKVMPIRSAMNLARSLTKSLKASVRVPGMTIFRNDITNQPAYQRDLHANKNRSRSSSGEYRSGHMRSFRNECCNTRRREAEITVVM